MGSTPNTQDRRSSTPNVNTSPVLIWPFSSFAVTIRRWQLHSWLRFPSIRPKRASDPAHCLAGQRIRWVGVDAGRADLRVLEDARDHMQVHVLLAQQGARGV